MKFTLNSGRDQYNSNTVKDKAKAVAQSTVATVQDTVQSGLAKTQDTLQTGLSAAQDALQQNVKRANKSLKKARKKMKPSVGSVQDSVSSSLGAAQDILQSGLTVAQIMLGKNVKKAVLKRAPQASLMSLKKAKRSIKDVQESVQDQLAGYRRKRKLARVLFRLGLLVGIALALLYTPWPGSDTRRQLAAWWQRVSSSMTNRT